LHAAENVLSAVRSGARSVTPALVGDCLTCLDQVVQWLDAMEAGGAPPPGAQAAADQIIALFDAPGVPAPNAEAPPTRAPAGGGSGALPPLARAVLETQLSLLEDPSAEASPGRTGSALRVAANVMTREGRPAEAARLAHSIQGAPDAPAARRAIAAALSEVGPESRDAWAAPLPEAAVAEPAMRGLRVDVERIDALVNLTGELTVAKNALAHLAGLARDGADGQTLATSLKDQHAVLERLVAELQRSVLNIRVLPLRQVFQRFPRLIREMVVSLGKPAHLVTEGDATEADKAIVEGLFEPLLHVLRNALDHGIESSAVRAAAGKPPSATLSLTAAREGDRVIVSVEDDGGGIDVARVRAVAAERGLLSAEVAAALSDQDAVDLIFAPGFSTAAAVTSFSGRGVGMDAVRSAVARLGGQVTVQSRPGLGTTVRFVMPFTVMMSQVMTVEAGGQVFGVPMDVVVETVHVPRGDITPIGAARAIVLRGRTIPLIDLGGLLGDAAPAPLGDSARVVIAMVGGQMGGLEVERLGEPLEVMLKPMEGLLAGAPGVAGTTLLGDGRVLIVLDLGELLN
jgi:two-component system chemotaxis sensor kinase CheA